MTRNACRMSGLIIIMVSIFFIIGGLFLKGADIPAVIAPVCLTAGLLLITVGTIMYKILKND